MKELLNVIKAQEAVTAKRGRRRFRVTLNEVARYLAAPPVRLAGTSVWVFGKPRSGVRRWVRAGRAEFRTEMRRGESFVILDLKQALAMCDQPSSRSLVAKLPLALPLVRISTLARRRIQVRAKFRYRAPP